MTFLPKSLVYPVFSVLFYVRNEKSKLILPDFNFPGRTMGVINGPIHNFILGSANIGRKWIKIYNHGFPYTYPI